MIHTYSAVVTSSRKRTVSPRNTSATIMIALRGSQSAATPAQGPTSTGGSVEASTRQATDSAEPVRCNSNAT